ncbi:MAG: flavin prenyltransferase UbiX [Pirellulales bacterium]
MNTPIVVGITGASGAVYAVRLLEVLRAAGRDVHLSISPSGRDVLRQELKLNIDLEKFDATSLLPRDGILHKAGDHPTGGARIAGGDGSRSGGLHYYHHQDFMSPMASGSFLSAGMVICPCSGSTLSAVANGAATNLIQRAAEVHLKERRKLVLVTREAPLSLAHIENMRRVTEAGAIVLPASPGWYHKVDSIEDLVNFVVARVCDQLGIEQSLTERWGAG